MFAAGPLPSCTEYSSTAGDDASCIESVYAHSVGSPEACVRPQAVYGLAGPQPPVEGDFAPSGSTPTVDGPAVGVPETEQSHCTRETPCSPCSNSNPDKLGGILTNLRNLVFWALVV